MSTRGLYGFRKGGVDKLTYNHSDSCPDCLGNIMLDACTNDVQIMREAFDYIEMVDEHEGATDEQIQHLIDRGFATNADTDNWYWLLRGLQGEPQRLIDEALDCHKVYMTDNHGFIKDSLFCEFAYIIDLDREVLEFYGGFQTRPQEGNRYGTEKGEGDYYPCRKLLEIPLQECGLLNAFWVEQMNEATAAESESEEN